MSANDRSILQHFSRLKDPRQRLKIMYPLQEILLLLLSGTIAGADDFVEIALWGREKIEFLRRFYAYANGIPSHDTLCDVIAALDKNLFRECFSAWIETIRQNDPEIIAVDGKTSRRSHNRHKGVQPLHLVSAWATNQQLVLGQEPTAEKSNEITAIPLLLKRLFLKGAIITIDAVGTQTDIAQTILDGQGDYVLAFKENWPATFKEVEELFKDPPSKIKIHQCQTEEKIHGRTERRLHAVCHDIDWLFSERSYPGAFKFPGLKALGMIESQTKRDGKDHTERRYYLLSQTFDVQRFAAIVRAHWGIENRLHWVLDVVFKDDLARLRSGDGPANMALIKHAALNLLNTAKPSTSLKNRRKKAGWNTDYLYELITQPTHV